MKTFISNKFWHDPDIEALDSGEKLTVLWLLTNSNITPLGFCNATPGRFSFETKLEPEILSKTVKKCQKMFTECVNTVFINNYIKWQHGIGRALQLNNFFIKLNELFLLLKPEQQQILTRFYPEFTISPLEGGCNPLGTGCEIPIYGNGKGKGNGIEGGVGGDLEVELPFGFPKSKQEAMSHAAFVGCRMEFAETCWHQAMARGGCDSKGTPIRSWRHHLACMARYHEEREAKSKPSGFNGEHRKTKEEREAEFAAGREERRRKVQEAIQNDQFAKKLLTVNKTNKESK